jgi:hypothetical protein
LARCTSTVTSWACKASSARLWTTARDMDLHHASAAPGHATARCTKLAPNWCDMPALGVVSVWKVRNRCRFTELEQWHGFCITLLGIRFQTHRNHLLEPSA